MPSFLAFSFAEFINKSNLATPALLLGFLLIFYFMLYRPQQKKQREREEWLKQLKKGDEIITDSGIWAKVAGVSERDIYVTIELQEKVRVRILRSNIAGKAPTSSSEVAANK